jgi:hypothetical protein
MSRFRVGGFLTGAAAICTILGFLGQVLGLFGQTPAVVGGHLHELTVVLKAQNWLLVSTLMLATAALVFFVMDFFNKRRPTIAIAGTLSPPDNPSIVGVSSRGQATQVKILSPVNGTFVGFKAVVTGTVDPPNTPVQVLVQANNEQWYPQGKNRQAEVKGSTWTVNCQFGDNNAASQHAYQIVAVTGTSVKLGSIPFLPDAVRSETISVKRTFD